MKLPISTFLLGLVLFMATASLSAQAPLEIKLIVPVSTPDGQRVIALERYVRLHVVVTNVSSENVLLWKDWNSWGYGNLSLQAIFPDGEKMIKRIPPPEGWDGDFPDFWAVKPGESIILEIDMSTGEWRGFPDLYGEQVPAQLTAIYENKTDPLAEAYDIWVGKLASTPVEVIFK